MSIGLYWCSTYNGDSDYWVVSWSAAEAREFFATIHGFPYSSVSARRVRAIPSEDVFNLDLCIPCDPTKEQLAEWGVEYNVNFHVFHFRKKIFRPESLVRQLMITHAKRARASRGRKRKRSSLRLVGPSSTSTT